MPKLEGFEPTPPRVGQVQRLETPAIGMAAQQLNTLSQRLQGFSDAMMSQHAEVVADEAANKALSDVEKTGTFDKKEVYTVYGKAYNTAAKAAYGAEAESLIDQKAQELALRYQNDPVGFSNSLKSFTDSLINQSPTPELRTTLGIYAGKVKNKGFGAISRKVDAELREGRKVSFANNFQKGLGQIVNSVLEGDIESAELQQFDLASKLDAMRASGDITPAEHQRLKIQGEYTLDHDIGVGTLTELLLDDNIEEAITFLEGETYENQPNMTPDQFDKYQTRLKSVFNEYRSRKKAEATNNKASSNILIKDTIELLKNGKVPSPDQQMATEAALPNASPEKQREYMIYDEANKQLSAWEDLSIAEKEIRYNELAARKEMTTTELEVQKAMGKMIAEEKTMSVKDPVGLALKRGSIQPLPNMAPDAGGVDGLLAGLKQMETDSFIIQDKYGEDKKQQMTSETAKEWADYMNSPDISINNKLEFIQRVSENAPHQAGMVFNQIGGKHAPTFLFAASTMKNGNKEAARLALKGKGANIELPTGFQASVTTYIGNALANFKGDALNTLKQGVIDYSKGKAMEGEDKMIDTGNLEEYFGSSIGYIVDYNGQDTILPIGVEESDFDQWLNEIEIPDSPELQEAIRDMPDIFFGGDIQLQYVDDGKYMIRKYNNGKPLYHTNEDGTTFILEYPKVK